MASTKASKSYSRNSHPKFWKTLQQAAIIQSTESSNRIEGVEAPLPRIKALIAQKTTPQNAREQEIAGYRDVLNTIHANYASMPFNTSLVLQLHRDLYQFLPGAGGRWKSANNKISETHPDGTIVVRFEPVEAFFTPNAMAQLHERFHAQWQSEEFEPLLTRAQCIVLNLLVALIQEHKQVKLENLAHSQANSATPGSTL